MNFPAAVDYILSFADYERLPRSALVFDLRRVAQLLERLGNPQNAARSVHIAGTKGKGSTAAMIAAILNRSGYRVGLYTSPHLLSITERMQVDGKPIAEDSFARLVARLKPEAEAVNRLGTYGELTTFELLTALAFGYFREMGVHYQVVETGLGGRLDATNVVTPEVCVITSISYDHMDVLGDTLARIATEKAGIIKPGSSVVCSPQLPEAMAVIAQVCRERGVPLLKVGSDVTWERKSFSEGGQAFVLKGTMRSYDLHLPLLGEHQLENAAAAVATVEVLSRRRARIPAEAIAAGLAGMRWPGRLQVLGCRPWVIIDGAHNAYSIKRLGAALRQYFTFARLVIIFGASADKDIAGMVAELAAFRSEVVVTGSRHPRAVAPAALAAEFTKYGVTPQVAPDVPSAVRLALRRAGPDDLICATGSIFVIAEVMEFISAGRG